MTDNADDTLLDALASSLTRCECLKCWCREMAPVTLRQYRPHQRGLALVICKDCVAGKHDRPREEPTE